MDIYITSLALIGHIDDAIGAYDSAEDRFVKLCKLLEEARSLPGYGGIAREPERYADYYTRCAFAQIKRHHYDDAYRCLMIANREYVTSDALFGMFHLLTEEEYGSCDWKSAVDYIQRAHDANRWMDDDRCAEAHYFLGMIYKDSSFANLVRTDIKKSHDMMVISADLGFNLAKEELHHYKPTLFGGYKYV